MKSILVVNQSNRLREFKYVYLGSVVQSNEGIDADIIHRMKGGGPLGFFF